MRAEDVREKLIQRPFRPFRMTLTDGRTYDVVHPEMALLTYSTVVVGIPGAASVEEPIADRAVTVSLSHVMQMEDVAASSRP